MWPGAPSTCWGTLDAEIAGSTFLSQTALPTAGLLRSNGGPTQPAAPLLGSPAVGMGQNCPPIDQPGVARPANGCTAGAVEGALP